MTFSLDLTKPLSRVGFLVNLVFLTVVFSGLSWLSFGYMTHSLPQGAIHAEEKAIAQKAQDQAFAKAKAAAKGKAFDEKAALAEANKAGLAAAAKEHDKIKHEAEALWSPFAVFLLIISAIFFAGFLSIALQRRVNEAGKNGRGNGLDIQFSGSALNLNRNVIQIVVRKLANQRTQLLRQGHIWL